eukprot:1178878-Pyramimonas_sp.AAC.1
MGGQIYTASPPAIGSRAGYIPPHLSQLVLAPGRSLKQAPLGAPGPDPVPVPVTRPIQVFRENQDVTPGPGGAPAEDAEEQ